MRFKEMTSSTRLGIDSNTAAFMFFTSAAFAPRQSVSSVECLANQRINLGRNEVFDWSDTHRSRRPGAGRPRATTSTDDRYIQLTARRNRTENATQLQRQLLLATGRRVSSQTVRNRLHEGGLYAHRSMVCIPLTPHHRAARRRWAAEHRDWEQHDWSQVLFTDES
ncbi:transposable element Tcb2 transposase [Trichonephila clavipes]|uniref:Transposable element Tcb2 transposase n=1 Tax=Trichonephila clavipes TaxID=2585209 RepID=A0A8X7B9N5_TRICX|nr:transposable element Tcb2 transposase [Trichonephila clavipes]